MHVQLCPLGVLGILLHIPNPQFHLPNPWSPLPCSSSGCLDCSSPPQLASAPSLTNYFATVFMHYYSNDY